MTYKSILKYMVTIAAEKEIERLYNKNDYFIYADVDLVEFRKEHDSLWIDNVTVVIQRYDDRFSTKYYDFGGWISEYGDINLSMTDIRGYVK